MREKCRPFLKWVGGKRNLVGKLIESLPPHFESYHEPFLGGGSLFFALYNLGLIRSAFLSDSNEELIRAYVAVREAPESVLESLARIPVDRKVFYFLRNSPPSDFTGIARAARMIYLVRASFNGLYRVNQTGRPNQSFGSKQSVVWGFDRGNFQVVSRALKCTQICCAGFEVVLNNARPGDLVYLDPPYVPRNGKGGQHSYSAGGFSMEDHQRLCHVARRLGESGVHVMITNSDLPVVHEMYGRMGLRIRRVSRSCELAGAAAARGRVTEIIATNYEPRQPAQLELLKLEDSELPGEEEVALAAPTYRSRCAAPAPA